LGYMDLSSVSPGTPWYVPYMEVAQDLNPYLTSSATGGEGQHFILTADEAASPGEFLTRYDFVVMTSRVLDAVNCYALQDSDGDGISDYDEVTVYFTDPFSNDTDNGGVPDNVEIENGNDPLDRTDDDSDGDTLIDNDERDIYGTDPFNPDTDYGGVNDNIEILNGTEPYQTPEDDYPANLPNEAELEEEVVDTRNTLEPGITIVTNECNVCPCPVSIENTADLAPGDAIFAAIMNQTNNVIHAVSEEVEIEELR